MRKTMNLKIVTPDRIFYEGKIDSITVRTTGGGRQILTNRRPFSSEIEEYPIRFKLEDDEKTVDVQGGFINTEYDKVTVITPKAEWVENE